PGSRRAADRPRRDDAGELLLPDPARGAARRARRARGARARAAREVPRRRARRRRAPRPPPRHDGPALLRAGDESTAPLRRRALGAATRGAAALLPRPPYAPAPRLRGRRPRGLLP